MATVDHLAITDEVQKQGNHDLSKQPSFEQGIDFVSYLKETAHHLSPNFSKFHMNIWYLWNNTPALKESVRSDLSLNCNPYPEHYKKTQLTIFAQLHKNLQPKVINPEFMGHLAVKNLIDSAISPKKY